MKFPTVVNERTWPGGIEVSDTAPLERGAAREIRVRWEEVGRVGAR